MIVAIEVAAKEKKILPIEQRKVLKLQDEVNTLRKDLERALGREMSLLYENYQLKKQLNTLNGVNVIPIRHTDP